MVCAGNGALSSTNGPKLLAKLSERGNIPVCTTLQGLGAFDKTKEKSLHMLGLHDSAYANLAMQQVDVIITLGGRFDDRVTGKIDTFVPAARAAVALVGSSTLRQPKNINKVVEASIPIFRDVWRHARSGLRTPSIRKKDPFTYIKSVDGARMKPQQVTQEGRDYRHYWCWPTSDVGSASAQKLPHLIKWSWMSMATHPSG